MFVEPIKDEIDIEVFAIKLAERLITIPSNVSIQIDMNRKDFDKLINWYIKMGLNFSKETTSIKYKSHHLGVSFILNKKQIDE